MLATSLLALLAMSSMCHGAALDRTKREAIVGELDRSFDLFGVHIGLKYKDPEDRLQGGKLRFAVDDMKVLFRGARSKRIDVNVDFDGGASKKDGLFNLDIKYLLEHADDYGLETGTLKLFREKRGNMWVSHLKTETSGTPYGTGSIIPSAINNAQIDVESDRETKLNLKYVNKYKSRDLEINVDRVPGKEAKVTVTNKGRALIDVTMTATDFNLRQPDGNFKVSLDGTVMGEKIAGSVDSEKVAAGHKVMVEISKGNKKMLQLVAKVKADPASMQYSTKTKYSLLGGVVTGEIFMKYENKQLTFVNTDRNTKEKVELRVLLDIGKKLEIEGKKNGVTMWSYSTLRKTVNNNDKFELTLETDMTLNSQSFLYTMMEQHYPYGAFKVRRNEVKIFIDKKNNNYFLPKFLVDVKLYKEGERVVTLNIDSTTKPYNFLFVAPNVFRRWNIWYDKIEGQMYHDIGKMLNIKTNLGGGIEIQAQRSDNSKGGRDIHILTKKAGKQMMKVDISTEKTINDKEIKLVLHDNVEIDYDSVLYRNIVQNYRILTPFNKRSGKFEIYVNKKENNALLPKFYVKGEVKKDSQTVMKALLTTNEKPYKMSLYLPALLNKIYYDMDKYEVTVNHDPGQMLEVVTNGKKFQGFKITKTGNGNERVFEVNGKKLSSGQYTLTDNSFQTKITLADGTWLEPKITWEGRLPNNVREATTFFLKNRLTVAAKGSRRHFDAGLTWKMDKPDFDFNTPWNCKMKLDLAGEGPNWGVYSIARDVTASVANKEIKLKVNGDASFTKGVFASISPVHTDVDLSFLMNETDLDGKFSEVMKGKEYSIAFPSGSFVMPKIVWGQ